MDTLKVTTWNVEHLNKLIQDNRTSVQAHQLGKVVETIVAIDADIIGLIEGPAKENGIQKFCSDHLQGKYVPVLLPDNYDSQEKRDRAYGNHMGGKQWVWYLVKPELVHRCTIQDVQMWHVFSGENDWSVNYWSEEDPSSYGYYRQPQVMRFVTGEGDEIEFIGVHLKSKINLKRITRNDNGNLSGDYLEEALKARVKLATQARNIRKYIDKRFEQNSSPAIVLLGDCNDGPGHDFFEQQYLFFDLIQNLQGDVMHAERFFNHALFDYPAPLRWTAQFRDPITRVPASENKLLIDHILMSQSLVQGRCSYQVHANAGTIEHEIFDRINASGRRSIKSSDHRPVSVILTKE